MLFGANLRAMLTNQWFEHTWSVEHFSLQSKELFSAFAILLKLMKHLSCYLSWFLLILYQSNLKLNIHISYHGNPA